VKLVRDTWLVFQRQMLLVSRSRLQLAFGIAQPITYLLLYAPMLRLALSISTFTEAYRIYVPGLLTVTAVLGGLFCGFGLMAEIRSGVIERARVTPVSRLALLLGRALREVVILMGQAVIVTVLALPFGLRVPIGDLLLAYLLLALMSLMAVTLSYGITLRTRNEMTLAPIMTMISQPIMLISGVLLPMTLAPLWLLRIAQWNPFYWATNGMRALFAGHLAETVVWLSLIIVIGMTIVATTWSVRLFARRLR
jgi:ABC-2 type transport system permease protein